MSHRAIPESKIQLFNLNVPYYSLSICWCSCRWHDRTLEKWKWQVTGTSEWFEKWSDFNQARNTWGYLLNFLRDPEYTKYKAHVSLTADLPRINNMLSTKSFWWKRSKGVRIFSGLLNFNSNNWLILMLALCLKFSLSYNHSMFEVLSSLTL